MFRSRMPRLVQISHPAQGRRVASVDEPRLRLIGGARSVYELALLALDTGRRLVDLLAEGASDETLDYDAVYAGTSEWSLLPAYDHPRDPAQCLVTGTGLTHRASAESRSTMHGSGEVTDSMKMYRTGLEGGRPPAGAVGAQPEWFYKGTGAVLRAHGQPLDVPGFALDGGEEAEIAGAYVVAGDGTPYRVGLVQGNEFSDHVGEARNYLYLAESKLRTCSVGPELLIPDAESFFAGEIKGRTLIERSGEPAWQGNLASGERWMCHTLANLEHHHFRNPLNRAPGSAHVHFLGADAFSFRDKVRLEDGDEMVIAFEGFGRPLRNPIRIDRSPEQAVAVRAL